ncbi:hypothetical protein GOBAR_AA16368 [Gossypium barbadense]|uniref:Uncharacterized protein n=1 Tax=Gossypium barbadense TaxID=3634 RepID=A0A2P5XLW2_GOSBA|nr:hypothetical protein GOBAR_AA16368 [Gossypium barbadense]
MVVTVKKGVEWQLQKWKMGVLIIIILYNNRTEGPDSDEKATTESAINPYSSPLALKNMAFFAFKCAQQVKKGPSHSPFLLLLLCPLHRPSESLLLPIIPFTSYL